MLLAILRVKKCQTSDIAFRHDKKAFISVSDITEVKGRGFKAKDI